MKYLQPNKDNAVILDKLPETLYKMVYTQAMSQLYKLYTKDNSNFYWYIRKKLYSPLNTIMRWNLNAILEKY